MKAGRKGNLNVSTEVYNVETGHVEKRVVDGL